LVETTHADLIIPPEVNKIDQLASEAFSKLKFFKMSETICGDGNCGTIYAEINQSEGKAHYKITQGNDTVEGYVIGGMTYEKGLGPSMHINTWRKTREVPLKISNMLNPKQQSLENCLKMHPTNGPDKISLAEGLIDGKECYVVDIEYPEQDNGNFLITSNKLFYQKNTHLFYGQHLTIESGQFKASNEIKYYDYDVPLEIKLPPEAINAKEVSSEEMKSSH
jgi:hypothetical protein